LKKGVGVVFIHAPLDRAETNEDHPSDMEIILTTPQLLVWSLGMASHATVRGFSPSTGPLQPEYLYTQYPQRRVLIAADADEWLSK